LGPLIWHADCHRPWQRFLKAHQPWPQHPGSTTSPSAAKKNPRAFIDGNINLLKVGSMLKIPTREEITGLTQSEARTVFNEQTRS